MKTVRWRMLPALGAGLLLLLAAAGAATNEREPSAAAPTSLYYPFCAIPIQDAAGPPFASVSGIAHYVQPVRPYKNVSACSLFVNSVPSTSVLSAVSWDPTTLTVDPTTIALRTQRFDMSWAAFSERTDFFPPVVVKTVSHVAEPPRPMLALDWSTSYVAVSTIEWRIDAPDSVPVAYAEVGSVLSPLSGAHTALRHWVCGGDLTLQALHVVQAVTRTDAALDSVECYVQKFRVPTTTQLYFVDLAFGNQDTGMPFNYGHVAIMDGGGQTDPPVTLGTPMVEADFPAALSTTPAWASHLDFTSSVVLQKDHDYWLWVEGARFWRMYTRALTGSESPDFKSRIGPLYRRAQAWNTFALDPAHALDFKIIGIPDDPTGVPEPIALVSPLRLHVMPNPARGASLVTWSGASGRVRFDVMDQAGRRVSGGSPAAGASGQWLWRATTDAGRAVAAGVYFVRATDAAGHAAVERVVVVR